MAKRPNRRRITERSSDNDKRRLAFSVPAPATLEALAVRVTYEGSGKHKQQPRAFGLEPAPPAGDDTFCDGHAGFRPGDVARVPDLLRRGIRAGLLGHLLKHGDPTILWTVDDDGWIYEARITIPGRTLYHGYPLLPSDAFARKVITRYEGHVDASGDTGLEAGLQKARDRYV